jgi:aspartate/methionine/tyrosine aminotransferase
VCVPPGKDFGSHQPERHLRFAYTVAEQRLEQGLERMRGYLQG